MFSFNLYHLLGVTTLMGCLLQFYCLKLLRFQIASHPMYQLY